MRVGVIGFNEEIKEEEKEEEDRKGELKQCDSVRVKKRT